jgi:hypothetical protein
VCGGLLPVLQRETETASAVCPWCGALRDLGLSWPSPGLVYRGRPRDSFRSEHDLGIAKKACRIEQFPVRIWTIKYIFSEENPV